MWGSSQKWDEAELKYREDIEMIVVKITDGLGNQLFQYAFARVLKTRVRQEVYLDISDINKKKEKDFKIREWMSLCDVREFQLDNFMITLPLIDEKELAKKYKRKEYTSKFLNYCREFYLLPSVYLNEGLYNENRFRFLMWHNYYIKGAFFDKKYYENETDILMDELKLKKTIAIPDGMKYILANRNTVSLHIRRGDFLNVGRDMSKSGYYFKALDYIKHEVKDPFLLIFSDDIEWVENNMNFDMEYMTISGRGFTDCEELTLMSMCRNHIMANSTFSYWGAWLNPNKDKIVTLPRGWGMKVIPNTWVQL